MTVFKEITSQEIQDKFPKLYREDAQYYSIMKSEDMAGLYGIIDRGNTIAETFMTVFDGFKHTVINKNSLFYMMNQPFCLGFKEVWTWTRWQSWIKLLQRFNHEGVEPQLLPPSWDNDWTKVWFSKRSAHFDQKERD